VQLLLFLILFPLIAAFILLIVRNDIGRNWIVKVSAIVIGAVSLFLLVTSFDKGIILYEFPSEPTGIIMFIIEILMQFLSCISV